MEDASVTVQLKMEDIVAFHALIGNARRWRLRVMMLAMIVVIYCFGFYLHWRKQHFSPAASHGSSFHPEFLWCVPGGAVILLALMFRAQWRFRSETHWKKTNPSVFLPTLYQVRDAGLSVENTLGQHLMRWTAIQRVVESQNHIYVMHSRTRGNVFPKRCFATPEAAVEFVEQVRRRTENHATGRGAGA